MYIYLFIINTNSYVIHARIQREAGVWTQLKFVRVGVLCGMSWGGGVVPKVVFFNLISILFIVLYIE